VAFLARGKRAVDQNQLGAGLADALGELLDLAFTDEIACVRPVAARMQLADDLCSGRFCERAEFLGLVLVTGPMEAYMKEQGSFAAAGTLKQSAPPASRPNL